MTLQADKLPQTLFISKRTDDDLFRMVDPAPLQAIYRYQSLPVPVAMAESRFFKPEQFEIGRDLPQWGSVGPGVSGTTGEHRCREGARSEAV